MATTPIHAAMVRAMLPYFRDIFGNPSAVCAYGQEARSALEQARARVASLIGAGGEEIIFTPGGTEVDNLALIGITYANGNKGNHIINTAIEHHAIIETAWFLEKRGFEVTYLGVDGQSLVNLDDVRRAITNRTILISVMQANNEMGSIAREAGICFHSDAVQAVGHTQVDVTELGVDLLSMSAHKFYSPKGVGALHLRKGTRLAPMMYGGGQERERRWGTENTPGIIGFGRAAELARQEIAEEAERLILLRDQLVQGILQWTSHSRLNDHPKKRLPNNVNISFDFVEGESLVLNLDLKAICASTGSACSSSSLEPPHVLLALGLPWPQAHGLLRLTLGKWTTDEDKERVLEVLPPIVPRLRVMSPLLKNVASGIFKGGYHNG